MLTVKAKSLMMLFYVGYTQEVDQMTFQQIKSLGLNLFSREHGFAYPVNTQDLLLSLHLVITARGSRTRI